MTRIKLKALSVNEAYRGRRFATPELKSYKKLLNHLLPKQNVPRGKLELTVRFGVSSKASDLDNLWHAFLDCLADKYGFNDRMVYKISLEKVDVEKEQEFVEFDITEL